MSSDEAKAVAETAKLGAELVKAGEGFGSYLAKVFGSIPEDALGLAGGDWLQHKRQRNLANLEAATALYLDKVDRARLGEPSPSALIPLLQAAVDESRDELKELWAGLLASLMTDGGVRVRRAYFEAVKEMEPQDAIYMEAIYHASIAASKASGNNIPERYREFCNFLPDKMKHFANGIPVESLDTARTSYVSSYVMKYFEYIGFSKSEIEISEAHLRSLGCVMEGVTLSSFGRGLFEACQGQG